MAGSSWAGAATVAVSVPGQSEHEFGLRG